MRPEKKKPSPCSGAIDIDRMCEEGRNGYFLFLMVDERRLGPLWQSDHCRDSPKILQKETETMIDDFFCDPQKLY